MPVIKWESGHHVIKLPAMNLTNPRGLDLTGVKLRTKIFKPQTPNDVGTSKYPGICSCWRRLSFPINNSVGNYLVNSSASRSAHLVPIAQPSRSIESTRKKKPILALNWLSHHDHDSPEQAPVIIVRRRSQPNPLKTARLPFRLAGCCPYIRPRL